MRHNSWFRNHFKRWIWDFIIFVVDCKVISLCRANLKLNKLTAQIEFTTLNVICPMLYFLSYENCWWREIRQKWQWCDADRRWTLSFCLSSDFCYYFSSDKTAQNLSSANRNETHFHDLHAPIKIVSLFAHICNIAVQFENDAQALASRPCCIQFKHVPVSIFRCLIIFVPLKQMAGVNCFSNIVSWVWMF